MLRWFERDAPIRRKMSFTIGVVLAIGLIGLAGPLAHERGLLDAGTATLLATVSVVGTLLFLLWVRHVVSAAYVSTVVRMEGLASGDLERPIDFTHYKDCVGRMARAMGTFRENALARITAEEEAAAQCERADMQRNENEAEREAVAQRLQQVMSALARALERLAAGNLVDRIAEAFPPEYDQLRADFNDAVGKLQETVSVVATSAKSIGVGSDEIARAADDLSRRTEQQAASLEETAAALEQITTTVRKTAASALQARETVGTAKQDAEHSGRVVDEAVNAMTEIEASSRQISHIIGVIDEIAFQTNLLALNAGVEAARAGEAGRGFAVVASEVRALAQRSAEAAKEIKALISASSRQVSAGVDLVGQTGSALGRIVSQVASINEMVAEIAAAAQEQATGLAEVNTAVNQMDQVTQQNAAMVEESTAASQALMSETGELTRLIAHFQVSEKTLPVAKPSHRTYPSQSLPPRSAPARAAAPLRVVSNRAPAKADAAWAEF